MLQKEFEQLTGMVVTPEEFNEINAYYMAGSELMNKEVFCADWKKHGSSEIIRDYYNVIELKGKAVRSIKEECRNEKEELKKELASFLIDMAQDMDDERLSDKAIELVGIQAYIRIKREKKYPITDKGELEYVYNRMYKTLK